MKADSKSPLVSVVIPCYNKGGVIEDAIKSIHNNTYTNIEIIVINDGSTDPITLSVLASIKEDGVKVIDQNNGGLSNARNNGVKEARGEYILFLDHDDLVSRNFIEESVSFLEANPEVGYVYPDIIFFGEQLNIKRTPQFQVERLKIDNYIPCSCMHRASIIKSVLFDETLPALEDWDFLLQLMQKGHFGAKVSTDIFLYYRIVLSNSMNNQYSKFSARLKRLRMINAIRRKRGVRLMLNQKIIHLVAFILYPIGHFLMVQKEGSNLNEYLQSHPNIKQEMIGLGIKI